jgi:MinD-like ATPase involved in chromosome partitioning or flagellar assembly
LTSSHDARQDWQASVLRDLTPANGEQNGQESISQPEQPEADDSIATQIVPAASVGATLTIRTQAPPAAPPAAPTPPNDTQPDDVEPDAVTEPRVSLPGRSEASDPLATLEPPAQQPGHPSANFAGLPAPQFDQYPSPAATPPPPTLQPAPQPSSSPPATPQPPTAPPTATPQPTSAPPQAYPGYQAQPMPQQPVYPPVQHYPGPHYPPAAPPQAAAQYQPFPAAPGYPPANPGVPAVGQGPSRVFGPDATPISQPWTPDGLLAMPNHADNWHQRIRSSVRGVGGSASKASREAAELARELTLPVTTGRRIAVLGIRGGSGKSTVASLLASAYATHRGDRVLAVDADPDLGSLGLRLGANSPTSLVSLGRVPRVWQTVDEAERCLGRAPSGAWILAGERGTAGPESVMPNAYLGVLHGISRYFAVTVVDAGAGMVTRLNQSVLADAHAIVLATPASIDGVVSARRALEWVREWGPQRLPQTIVALTAMSPQASDIDMARTIDALAPFGVLPALLPYDRHLATGSTIEPWRLGEQTRDSAVQLAATTLTRARSV